MSQDPVRIMRFWQAVEVFSPQTLPRRDPAKNTWDVLEGKPMPWEPGFRLPPPKPEHVWRHDVYGGVYQLRGVRDVLVAAYGQDRPEQAPARGESALFACRIDHRGRLIEGSTVVSACAWAVGRVSQGQSPLGAFQEETRHHAASIARAATITAGVKVLAAAIRDAVPEGVAGGVGSAVTGALAPFGGPLAVAGGAAAASAAKTVVGAAVGRIGKAANADPIHQDTPQAPRTALSEADLRIFSNGLARRLGVHDVLRPAGVRVRSYQIRTDTAEDDTGQPFLNSFLADDLELAEAMLRADDAGAALASYLVPSDRIDTARRVNVREHPRWVLDGCQPDRIPEGRWVTDTSRPLAFSQQFAVNQIMRAMGDRQPGLFAVNGPPGTGKTTMLRDLIAAIIVRRAEVLSSLRSPDDAFTGKPLKWEAQDWPHTITPLIPALTGHEIVVASSNNAAVENVTSEIPGPSGIAGQWEQSAADLDYFRATASQVTGDGAWALIAAVLGNAENRTAFVRDFWFGGESKNPRTGGGMLDVLKPTAWVPDWRAAQARFRESLAKVQSLSAERLVVSRQIAAYPAAVAERDRAAEALQAASAGLQAAENRRPPLADAHRQADRRWRTAAEILRAHEVTRPGWLSLLTARGRRKRADWKATQRRLADGVVTTGADLAGAERTLSALDQEITGWRETETTGRSAYSVLIGRVRDCERVIGDARHRWGDRVPTGPEYDDVAQRDLVERRELSAPWADEEFGRARTELFLSALALHKAFVLAEGSRIRKNLNALVKILRGGGRPEPTALLAAWQTLFLVVPVVSSTFASFGRLFSGLGRESLGWLLVDEAGQAAPQNAVGALLRSRSAVIVGDPLQLEPVVTLPWAGQQALLREFGVSAEWAPSRTSVQQVADRLAPVGTWLDGAAGDPVWVGTPLRVHRRCDRPMFEASNRIAYDGMMVFGTPERERFHGANAWYDVRSGDSIGHWIPEEGRALREILTGLRDAGVPAAQIRVLSPFRDVVAEAAKIHAGVFEDVETADRNGWVGTVHRMQGREADAVIMVLGGDPGNKNARRFAIEAPNLLNVAVTRARRRFYIVGNRETWGGERYFGVLTDENLLRHYRPER